MVNKFIKSCRKLVLAPCCLMLGLACNASAEDFSSFAQYNDSYSEGLPNFASMPAHQLDATATAKPMNLVEAFWAAMFDEKGVKAFGVRGGLFASPGDGRGFIIKREEADLKFQFRF